MGKIATEQEAKEKLNFSGTVDTNKCCTKAKAIELKANITKLSGYNDNQLVQLSDLDKGEAQYIYFNIWGDVPYKGTAQVAVQWSLHQVLIWMLLLRLWQENLRQKNGGWKLYSEIHRACANHHTQMLLSMMICLCFH